MAKWKAYSGLPDDPDRGIWHKERFTFHSKIAPRVNGELVIFSMKMTVYELVLLYKGSPAVKSAVRRGRNLRCAYMKLLTAKLKEERYGSGGYGKSKRSFDRSRKGKQA